MSTRPTKPALPVRDTIRGVIRSTTRGIVFSRRHTRVIAAIVIAGAVLSASLLVTPVRGRALAFLAGARYLDQHGVIRQQDADDCGVAVLAMIVVASDAARAASPFAHTLDSLRSLIRARGRGLSMLELRQLVAARGLDARGLRASYPDLSRIPSPFVAHFRDHYVVVDRVTNGAVTMRDPAIGRLQMPRASFERRWTGHVLVIVRPVAAPPR